MSTEGLQYVRAIDSRLNVNASRQKTYAIVTGAPRNNYRLFPATAPSNSNINITCTPNNVNTYINRRFLLRMRGTLTLTGTSAGAGIPLVQMRGAASSPGVPVGNNAYDAPRCRPLSQLISSLTVSIGGQGFNRDINTYDRIYQRFYYDKDQEDGEATPCMPDKSQQYSDLNGTARDPLNPVWDNAAQDSRGSFPGIIITRNDSTGAPGDTAIISWEFTEMLMMSPLNFAENMEELAFIGINEIVINAQLNGRGSSALSGGAAAIWSHSTLGSALTAATINVTGAEALLQFLDPNELQTLPSQVDYSYYEPTLYSSTNNGTIAPGASVTLAMNSVTLGQVPNRVYIWADAQDSAFNITSTDTFMGVTPVSTGALSILWGNQPVLLSTASAPDLYNISRRAGLNLSWGEFIGQVQAGVGSIICLQFGIDIPLESDQAPGVRISQTFQVTGFNVTNISSSPITPTLRVLVVTEGIVSIKDASNVAKNLGVLNQQQVVESWSTEPIPMRISRNIFGSGFGFVGGSFWDDVLTFFKRGARAGLDVAKTVAPQYSYAYPAADKFLSSYGAGYGGAAAMGRPRGGRFVGSEEMKMLM